ncbi:NAD(P)-dependent oxidoreductase [Nocardia speluncae]|uniref:NAD(P)-dependent oxidoreductase n=1 Tax=Nocardia speluncae TaxID=419477 RepID=A0A846XDQ3_9NOCA|nr:NAD(P)-dependent oxidoreductase [Nocardia speluncae]NKY34072.1 NAD(P)-dependent oxidoreductase [Nocardia speluncae]
MSGATRVGFIGLGDMGAPMAKKLLDWSGGLTVCDTRPEAVQPFTEAGAEAAGSPAELAAKCGVICIAVVNDQQVRTVLTGENGVLSTAAPGTVVAVHSTIGDESAVEFARLCTERGVELVDAPISGGAAGANSGRLAVMAGGSESAVATAREPFRCFADLVVHAGEVGAGTRMKLARNLLHFISFTAATEAQRLAEAAGLDITALGKVVRHSDAVTGGAGSIMLRDTTAPIAEGDFWLPILTHVRELGEKDLSLALELGGRVGTELPLATLALSRFGDGLGVGQGEISAGWQPAPAAQRDRSGTAGASRGSIAGQEGTAAGQQDATLTAPDDSKESE